MYSFITSGNFIIFKYTEDNELPQLREEHEVFKLHNTSKCIDWSLTEDTTLITFTIDEERYENVPLSSIDFDGEVCETQSDFIDGVQGMFENLSGGGDGEEGGGTILSATVTLTDAQIKTMPSIGVQVIAAPGADKMIQVVAASFKVNTQAGAYTNVTNASILLAYENSSYISAPCTIDNVLETTTIGYGNLSLPINFLGGGAFDGSAVTSAVSTPEWVNQAVIVWDDWARNEENYTGGNAANTLKVTVYYVVVDL